MSEILKAFLENEAAIRRFLGRRFADAQDVEDYTQETFVRGFAAERRGDIRAPKAFLFEIAKNVALGEIRKTRRSPAEIPDDPSKVVDVADIGCVEAIDWLDCRRKLSLATFAVANLPPQCRKAFLLRRIDGLQYKQIANRMNISVSAVEKHIATAMIKCAAYMRERGYEPEEFGAKTKDGAQKTPGGVVRYQKRHGQD
ncbi:MAG: sigma-70 family RNA polymerase sigma factor [Parvularculaceae bacterium]|nr:sigma-70 family RNA polymerase sigma factor [Parvularculaceae bacterium]